MRSLHNTRVVLIRPTHPGNIGGVARAMKNMGLSSLYLVAPSDFPNELATARAAGADDVLRSVRVVDSLNEAIADCRLVIGTSARQRAISWPHLSPRDAMTKCYAENSFGLTAMLFGQERSGLTNQEVDRCQFLVTIPTNDGFPSLNLVSAVQIMTYELRLAYLGGMESAETSHPEGGDSATAEELNGFFQHLEQVLDEFEFL
ncbi:MAG: RNA methyltransferase, partial [Gammaproteobacteria bacterium]|nr:RNA methyltransferase [Gammaproteobacteria bacterium]